MTLHEGQAEVPAPASLDAGTPDVIIGAALPPSYGDLLGLADDTAALSVSCANTGGTADGQIDSTWVVFEATSTGPQPIGVLTTQHPSGTRAYFDAQAGIVIRPGSVTVKELWYGPSDGTCCPSGRATTTWTYKARSFSASTVITHT